MTLVNLARAFAHTFMAACLVTLALTGAASAGTFPASNKKDLQRTEARIRASQFLSRATFGASMSEIDSLADRIQAIGVKPAFEEWIDDQFTEPPTYQLPRAEEMIHADGFPDFVTNGISVTNYRHYAWWDVALTAPDQLRQRMAWALSQIFVINDFASINNSRVLDDSGEPRYLGVVSYYDMLVRNAFGNYRTTLGDVTHHPEMGLFLSHLGNKKADPVKGTYPDENYAREVQQLFSIGLYLIKRNGDYVLDKHKDPIDAYTNDDIVTFARVFTGLYYANNKVNLHDPMHMIESWHDTDPKTLHNGVVLPAGQTGEQDISDALDNLFNHQNTAPFIARLLIQRFVKSNPSSRYIDAVASAFDDNGTGVRGDFKAVIKAILLNDEAVNSLNFSTSRKPLALTVTGGGTENSRLQEPVIRYAEMIRAFDGLSTHPAGYMEIPDFSRWLNQEVYRAPHVFNFYLPDHVPGGPLQDYRPKGRLPNRAVYAPEFEIMTSVAMNRIANRFRADIYDREVDLSTRLYDKTAQSTVYYPFKILLDLDYEESLAQSPEALLEHLDILLCQGSMGDSARNAIVNAVASTNTSDANKAEGAVLAVLDSPDCAIHE